MSLRPPLWPAVRILLTLAALAATAAAQSYSWTTLAGQPPATGTADGTGAAARFHFPTGLASDSFATVYVCDSANHTVRRITAAGAVSTYAGSPGRSGSTDGRAALFNSPAGLALARDGSLYIADRLNHLIRRLALDGSVSTIAGQAGLAGSADGPAAAARFNEPWGLAFDPASNLYIVERGNATVRRLTPEGLVSTVAGTAGLTGATDGTGPAARFSAPTALTTDSAGNFVVADTGNATIRKFTAAGVVTTFAGTAGLTGTAHGTGPAARFTAPLALVGDANGNIYVADAANDTIRIITAAGVVGPLIGGADPHGYLDGPGNTARFLGPAGLAISTDGFLYIADSNNHSIRRAASNLAISTIAGPGGNAGSADGPRATARLNGPLGLGLDATGNLFVADSRNSTIRRVTPAGLVTTVAGAAGEAVHADSFTGSGRFGAPAGLALIDNGLVVISDPAFHTLRSTDNRGTTLTIAGSPGAAGATDGPSAAARFNTPWGLAADRDNTIYVADAGNHVIRRLAASAVTTVAGLAGLAGANDGTPGRLNAPRGVALDAAGNLFIADTGNHTIRKLTPAGVLSTVAGLAGSPGHTDGATAAARFNTPGGLAVDRAGNLFVADTGNHLVRRITPAGLVTTIGGSVGTTAPAYADGSGAAARFLSPSAIAVDAAGVLYVVEAGNNLLVKGEVDVAPVITAHPASLATAAGSATTLSVSATGGGLAYQWKFNGALLSGATAAAFTVASAQPASAGSYTVTVSNSLGQVTSAPAVLTVAPAAQPGRLINLSVLTDIAAVGDSFTLGYVVGGNGTLGSKPLVLRAAGPSLGALGVPGTLADPKLELFAGSALTGENDDWGGAAPLTAALANVGAFPYTGPASKDAAVAAFLTTRDNSVAVSSAANGTGKVIAEIYDATPAANFSTLTPRLLNVSVRKHLGSGLTAGFVLGGGASTNVLIRAVGPGLAAFGVPDTVVDPQLTLFNSASVKLDANDNWSGTATLTAAFARVGAFALPATTSKDAALLVTLPPGGYTVEVTGVNATTGVALVEVYEVP